MTAAHNDRCDSLLGRGCDCRSPWAPDTAGQQCPATRTLSFGCGFTCGLTSGHEGKHIDPATATGWADEDFEPAEGRHV